MDTKSQETIKKYITHILERNDTMKKQSIIALLLSVCLITTACSNTSDSPDIPDNNSSLSNIEIDRGGEVKINVSGIDGRPFVPGGSAITAASTILAYYGISIKPFDLRGFATIEESTSFIDGTSSPWKKIVGNPKGALSFYFAPPIVDMLNTYYTEYPKKCKDRTVTNISGADLAKLKSYIDNQKPVIVWGTITGNAAVPVEEYSWVTDEGEEFIGKMAMRCYTMIGYNNSEVILISDNGKTLNVLNETFLEMYESMESQAILIE